MRSSPNSNSRRGLRCRVGRETAVHSLLVSSCSHLRLTVATSCPRCGVIGSAMPFSVCRFASVDPTVSTFRQDAANAANFALRGSPGWQRAETSHRSSDGAGGDAVSTRTRSDRVAAPSIRAAVSGAPLRFSAVSAHRGFGSRAGQLMGAARELNRRPALVVNARRLRMRTLGGDERLDRLAIARGGARRPRRATAHGSAGRDDGAGGEIGLGALRRIRPPRSRVR